MRRATAVWITGAAVVASVALVLAILVLTQYQSSQRADRVAELEEELDLLSVGATQREDAIRDLQAQVRGLGEAPVVSTPPEDIGPPVTATDDGPVIVEGPPGPAGSAGRPGDPGSPGPPGRGPTAAEIAQAVATYCAANGGCRGPQGPDGETVVGPPGESIQGPPGPAPTVDEIAAAVAAHCATGACTGPAGVAGSPGPAGPAGPPGDSPTPEEVARIVARVVASMTFDCDVNIVTGTATCRAAS